MMTLLLSKPLQVFLLLEASHTVVRYLCAHVELVFVVSILHFYSHAILNLLFDT